MEGASLRWGGHIKGVSERDKTEYKAEEPFDEDFS
jgi:hypothetical protein